MAGGAGYGAQEVPAALLLSGCAQTSWQFQIWVIGKQLVQTGALDPSLCGA